MDGPGDDRSNRTGRERKDRDRTEFVFDIGLGVSAAAWAVLGWGAVSRPLSVRLSLSVINLAVAALFLFRSRAHDHGTVRTMVAALPAIVLAAATVKLTHGAVWSVGAQTLFVTGAALTVTSLLALGQSFALLPSLRRVVARGPYRMVRHPAYASELLIAGACTWVNPWPAALILGLLVIATVLRIAAEERVLTSDEAYRDYVARVRWRLLPGVY